MQALAAFLGNFFVILGAAFLAMSPGPNSGDMTQEIWPPSKNFTKPNWLSQLSHLKQEDPSPDCSTVTDHFPELRDCVEDDDDSEKCDCETDIPDGFQSDARKRTAAPGILQRIPCEVADKPRCDAWCARVIPSNNSWGWCKDGKCACQMNKTWLRIG